MTLWDLLNAHWQDVQFAGVAIVCAFLLIAIAYCESHARGR